MPRTRFRRYGFFGSRLQLIRTVFLGGGVVEHYKNGSQEPPYGSKARLEGRRFCPRAEGTFICPQAQQRQTG